MGQCGSSLDSEELYHDEIHTKELQRQEALKQSGLHSVTTLWSALASQTDVRNGTCHTSEWRSIPDASTASAINDLQQSQIPYRHDISNDPAYKTFDCPQPIPAVPPALTSEGIDPSSLPLELQLSLQTPSLEATRNPCDTAGNVVPSSESKPLPLPPVQCASTNSTDIIRAGAPVISEGGLLSDEVAIENRTTPDECAIIAAVKPADAVSSSHESTPSDVDEPTLFFIPAMLNRTAPPSRPFRHPLSRNILPLVARKHLHPSHLALFLSHKSSIRPARNIAGESGDHSPDYDPSSLDSSPSPSIRPTAPTKVCGMDLPHTPVMASVQARHILQQYQLDRLHEVINQRRDSLAQSDESPSHHPHQSTSPNHFLQLSPIPMC